MSKKSIDWKEINEGTQVIAKYKGEVVYGIFVAIAGGKDKGKLRINLDGDTAQYREVKIADVDLESEVIEEKALALVPDEKPVKPKRKIAANDRVLLFSGFEADVKAVSRRGDKSIKSITLDVDGDDYGNREFGLDEIQEIL